MRLLWLVGFALLPAFSLTQSAPFGTKWEIDRNVKMEVSVLGYSANGKKVSGTNENFSAAVNLPTLTLDDPVYTGTEPWTTTEVVHLKIWIGDTLLGTYTPTSAFYPFTKSVRFATTHFNDGSDIEIKVEGKFLLSRTGEAKNVTVTSPIVEPVAYNKGLILATQLDGGGNYVDPASSGYRGSPPGAAEHIVDDARTKLGPNGSSGMKHDVVPSTAIARQTTEASVKSNLESATVFVAATHGDLAGFNDSFTKGTANPGYVTWSEVVAAVGARGTTIPLPNLVVLYSCHTLVNENDITKRDSFSVTGANRAYVGFAGDVASKLKKGDTSPLTVLQLPDYLDDHSKVVMSELAAGKRLSLAIDEANLQAPPRTINPTDPTTTIPIYPHITGDNKTRLIFVYLTLSEISAILSAGGSIDTWYYIS